MVTGTPNPFTRSGTRKSRFTGKDKAALVEYLVKMPEQRTGLNILPICSETKLIDLHPFWKSGEPKHQT